MGNLCMSCKNEISENDKPFQCVCCTMLLNMTIECTLLSTTAIAGIQELGVICILLCNTCIDNNERHKLYAADHKQLAEILT